MSHDHKHPNAKSISQQWQTSEAVVDDEPSLAHICRVCGLRITHKPDKGIPVVAAVMLQHSLMHEN